ncbi:hypothetical protein PHYBLDRAFT_141304 [Phycomyces blakesleeanus NRRL 1555(-)]|uniref:Uncharacterized protein n=1 Tax=Phycomyces blakesleeanus (strain ATCC 8743b / DSM 1359 / FGSC 10004 / NBRC 33097 / NRRL 1555) TaxID=763407 RepID=A0A162XZ73_PHYB8|nr:hypothetical protein PHYBLDRAFT_141304 [Phycomyces blakesleeanus NRRL 1555(-)]OAD77415.1 hypothetical protein PHYBLDRAFT_141304 [Phycomyces blakesleeanus NRRL 1555(-)]|eukprot:XP_018295455.1 hypothetical protein PHYBLDRAFT_141304 [Phycomyces blakesleeanus NRRL 1555(-)]
MLNPITLVKDDAKSKGTFCVNQAVWVGSASCQICGSHVHQTRITPLDKIQTTDLYPYIRTFAHQKSSSLSPLSTATTTTTTTSSSSSSSSSS